MQVPPEDVALSRLANDVVQNTYKEMHALLDSLTDLPPEARREKLVDFTLSVRHRFTRLLVAVRWFMMYSAFHGSAQVTKRMATTRSGVLTENADILWRVSGFVKGAVAHPSAIAEAAEILGSSSFFARYPRVIEKAIGIDASAHIHDVEDSAKNPPSRSSSLEDEATERLQVSTFCAVRNSMPTGVKVINSRVDPKNAAVRIGVPGSWTADVILDRLSLEDALLILLRFEILVGGHPDAQSVLNTPWRVRDEPMRLRTEQREPLRQMISDRMQWTMRDTEAVDKASRMKSALLCLSSILSLECAAKIAIEHVRTQLSALTQHTSWKIAKLALSGVGSEAKDDMPVRVRYWQKSHRKAEVAFRLPSQERLSDAIGGILQISHSPPLPGRTHPKLEIRRIHAERYLLETCRHRAQHEVKELEKLCRLSIPSSIQMKIAAGYTSSSLDVYFARPRPSLSFGISHKTGGLFVRLHGAVALALSRAHSLASEFRNLLWVGERFFAKSGLPTMCRVAVDIIEKALSLVRLNSSLEGSCAIGVGFIPTWPPGDSFVEKPEKSNAGRMIRPPFMPVDRKRPRRFLTLCSMASEDDEVYCMPGLTATKRARSLPMHFTISSSENQAFIEGRRPEGVGQPDRSNEICSDANRMAILAEVRHATEVRMRRDHILREVKNYADVIDGDFSLRSPYRSPIKMKPSSLEVESAALIIKGNEGWQIRLTLTNDIFDATNLRGQTVSYFPAKRLLLFSYDVSSIITLKRFFSDFERATKSAALIKGLSAGVEVCSIVRRGPSFVTIDVSKFRLTVGVRSKSFQLGILPPQPVISKNLFPLMEEVMEASERDAGRTLARLLEASLPLGLALQEATWRLPESMKVYFFTALKVKVLYSLARGQLSAWGQFCCIEIDASYGAQRILIMDAFRVRASADAERDLKPVPVWENIVKKVVSEKRGRSHRDNAVMEVPLRTLKQILASLTSAFS